MKKIMFSERFGLMGAVIKGYKNQTRRYAKALNHPNVCDISEWGIDESGKAMLTITYDTGLKVDVYPRYQINEVVSISQPYCEIGKEGFIVDSRYDAFRTADWNEETRTFGKLRNTAGYKNAMFVKAEYMPHRICITDIKVERLQDISDEDCVREGIVKTDCVAPYGFPVGNGKWKNYRTPQDAFAALIDRISGRGTWQSNPWVYAYTFELIE